MSGKQAFRKGSVKAETHQRHQKKARIDEKASSKPIRKATPPPKTKVPLEVPTVFSSAKGKEKARTSVAAPSDHKGKAKATSKPKVSSTSSSLPSSFKIIAGSYEKLLYGLEGTVTIEDSNYMFKLKPVFIFPAHISCVKAVAASPNGGKWLATGSADEIIKVWDLRRRKEIGGLMHHEGSITHLEFPSRSHLLSASEDGTLCLFRARDWAVLRSLKGHKGRVNSVAIHPSGKVALSVGKDRTLRMWDLMRGKGSASTKIGKEGELVRWSSDGTLFVVQSHSTIDVYTTDMTLLHTLTHSSRLHDVKFVKRVQGDGELLLAAGEDKKLSIYDIPSDRKKPPTIIAEMVGHSNRVKAVDAISISLPQIPNSPNSRTSTTIICTISSDGKIRLFDLASLPSPTSSDSLPGENAEKLQINSVAEYDTKGSRLTCLALADGDASGGNVLNGKRKREGNKEEEEEEWGSEQEDEEEDEDEIDEEED